MQIKKSWIKIVYIILILFLTLQSHVACASVLEADADGMKWQETQIDAQNLDATNSNWYGNSVDISQDGALYVTGSQGEEKAFVYRKGIYGSDTDTATWMDTTVRPTMNSEYSTNSDQYASYETDTTGARIPLYSDEEDWDSLLVAPRNLSSYALPPYPAPGSARAISVAGGDYSKYYKQKAREQHRSVWVLDATLSPPTGSAGSGGGVHSVWKCSEPA